MFSNLKAMVVVLVTAVVVFALVKPVFLRFMEPGDFERRRNLWLVLTAAGFLSPNIWMYILVAAPMLLWTASRDSNPAALWLFTVFVVPPVNIPIPTILINQLFTISQERLLGLILFLPMAVHFLRTPSAPRTKTIKVMDALLLAYGAYQIVLVLPYDNLTNAMRRSVLYLLDIFLVYFVFSRALSERWRMKDAMAALCLACIVVAPLALFENVRNWLLYTSIPVTWGSPNEFAWLLRGDSLRSQLSTGHSITMGYVMATALSFWLYLKAEAQGARFSWAFVPCLCAAILVSYARATWLMAAMLPVLGFALSPRRSGAAFKSLMGAALLLGGLYASPLGTRIVDLLPLIGSGDQGTIDYRQALAETSWQLIQQNPVFGNPFAYLQMENLRQGQGIIDMVNAYAGVAVFQGLVGLALYAGFFFTSVGGALGRLREARYESDDLAAMGAALVACMVATLVFMATVPGAWFMWALAGILAAYSSIAEPAPSPVIEVREGRGFAARHALG
jgi:hypothetical protein